MKKYETPDQEVIYFDSVDIIMTSGDVNEGEDPNPDFG